ncbi:ADP-glyceromanno-heptose 6-epimerase [Aquirufa lenticrescens]|uniref:ADP-glyceromanno-heptose 6-epimerase n=1 Tax=Aquirufa lenticrescens TaxID=2696560 RepID=UPI001CAA7924|nr:ADP-glyceromanno-heptose 6-epimerase [Aquirufa lenticrescens]UAJ14205.1 ADP-glyceromanno-heptose 6-epimerase [Aquirufa lenticrescens]
MKTKKILITGGAGFIGSNIAFEIQKRFPEYKIVIFDKFNNRQRRENGNFMFFGDYKNILGLKAEIISGDLAVESDLNSLLKDKFEIIFHQGAISDTTVLNQEEVLKTNTISFHYLVNYCLVTGCKLIYASSAGTYGNTSSPNKVGVGEIPENIYGYSKLQMDEIARSCINHNRDLHIIGLRYFNVYGPGEVYKRKTSSMILQLAKNVIDKKPLRLFKFGDQCRDFVYIKDVVEANIQAINGQSGIYNVGSGKNRSFNEVVSILGAILGQKIQVEYFDNPFSFYQNNTCADLSETINGIGYNPKYTLEMGMSEYIKEIQEYSDIKWKSFNE